MCIKEDVDAPGWYLGCGPCDLSGCRRAVGVLPSKTLGRDNGTQGLARLDLAARPTDISPWIMCAIEAALWRRFSFARS